MVERAGLVAVKGDVPSRTGIPSLRGETAFEISAVAESVEKRFQKGRRVLSFSEYLELFASDPVRYARDASRYVRDCFDHYGTTSVEQPWGKFTRWNLFDLPWDPRQAPHALVGQEQVQEEIYRALSNFVREGRPNRLVLLHGPNGSAKSTIVACMMRALEHYSTLDEGALYRFHWVFPSIEDAPRQPRLRAEGPGARRSASYAHLADDQIDAKLLVEVRDHPLFLIPVDERQKLLERLAKAEGRRAAERRTSATGSCAASSRTRASRSSRRCSRATTARTPRCCGTCRSSATSSRSATASARSRSARR